MAMEAYAKIALFITVFFNAAWPNIHEMEKQKKKDFFISYTSADREWAEWIAWILESKGYSTIIDVWDFRSGQDFILEMQNAITESERIIAVISPAYFAAKYTAREWANAFHQDPFGEERLLIPVRVKSGKLPGMWGSVIHINLIDNLGEDSAVNVLLKSIRLERNKPQIKPSFPLNKPSFPIQVGHNQKNVVSHKRSSPVKSGAYADYKIGQLDRLPQFKYLGNNIPRECTLKKGKTMGFIAHGPTQEWPESINHKLTYLLSNRIGDAKYTPNQMLYNRQLEFDPDEPEIFLWDFLSHSLNITGRNREKEIKRQLEHADTCYIFSRKILLPEAQETKLLVGMLSAWLAIKLKPSSPHHFLLLICESDRIEKKIIKRAEEKEHFQWVNMIEDLLKQNNLERSLLPPTTRSPDLYEDITDWLISHIEVEDDEILVKAITNKTEELKNRASSEQTTMPLLHLREELKEVFKENSLQQA